MKNIFTSLVEWFLAGSKLGVNETLSRHYRDFIETLSGHYREKNHYLTTKFAAAFLMLLTLGVGQVWSAELTSINFKSWSPQSISAGSTVNGCYFKSAVTISAANGATFGGKASTSSNWVAIPLSGINGSITITLTHASGRPQWMNYFKGLNAAPSSSDLSSNPSSMGDNTRPGSNTTTSSWTINTDKLYGVFYVGKGSNGLSDIYTITITTPDWTYYYRGADNGWGADAMTKSSEGFYSYKSSSTKDHQFKIAKSTSTWDYNHSFVDAGYLGTSITTIGDYGGDNCYIWSAPASYYIIVFRPGSAMNTTANPKICASATLPAEKFTISFNNGGGSGSMSSISNVLYGSEKATTANTFTKSGYRFTGWKADVDVKVGGATKTAGTLLDDEVTIQDIKSDITLTAQWEVDDGCNKIFWFANSADATTNGVTNNTTTFSGVNTGTSAVTGSITIDGKTYTATGRGSNNTTTITFTVPANKVGTLYGLANSSGSSARTLTLTNTDSYSETQSTSASSSTAGAFTFEDMPAGSYSLAWSGNGAENMLCLKLCDPCPAPTGLAVGSITSTGATFTVTDPEGTDEYEFYYSTSSTAPIAGTAATTSVSGGNVKSVTSLTANTTYYAWVRTKCSASNKSDWVAASPATFTTLAPPAGATVYLGATNIWNADNAVFEVYYFKSSNTSDNGWVSMTEVENCTPTFSAEIPTGYDKCIFVRMNPAGTAHDWSSKWNQTLDLTVADGNYYTITSVNGCTDGKSCGTWSDRHAITFNMNGHGSQCTLFVPDGTAATEPSPWPEASGYNFGGWYTDAGCTSAVDWSTNITEDKTYYALWTAVPTGLDGKYTMHTGNAGDAPGLWTVTAFTQVGATTEELIENYEIPATTHLYVGYQGVYRENDDTQKSGLAAGALGTECSGSKTVAWADVPAQITYGSFDQWQGQIFLRPNDGTLANYAVGQATGAKGTLQIYHDSKDKNLYLNFLPDGYGIKYSDGTKYAFTNTSSNIYETDAVTVADVTKTFFVGLKKAGDDYAKSGHSPATDAALSTIKIVSTSTGIANGAIGKFRMWNNSNRSNWNVQFVPCYVLTYDANGGTGTMEHQYVETSAASKNVTVRANGFTAPTGMHFIGWATSEARADAGTVDYLPGATYNLTAQATLYAVWVNIITLDNQSATTAGTTSVNVIPGTNLNIGVQITVPTKTDYTFGGYYTGTGGSGVQIIKADGWFNWTITDYVDGSGNWIYAGGDVTLYAHWKSCSSYSFHYGTAWNTTDWSSECFTQVGSSHVWQIENFVIPNKNQYYVGYQEEAVWSDLGVGSPNKSKSEYAEWDWTPSKDGTDTYFTGTAFLAPNDGTIPAGYNFAAFKVSESDGQSAGAKGTIQITDNVRDYNLYVRFLPSGYGLTYNSGTIPFTITGTQYIWETAVVQLSAADAAGSFQVKLKGDGATYVSCAKTITDNAAAIGARTGATTPAANLTGKFRMYEGSEIGNWHLIFVPIYATVYNFSNGNFHDWGNCAGGNLTLEGSQSGVSYQLYKDGVASGSPVAGTGSNLIWHVTESGVYTVRSVANANYSETVMSGSADVQIQDPTLSGPNKVKIGETITLTHPGYLIAGDNWVSSNPAVATVSSSGVVTGVSAGTVTITFHGVTGCDGTMVVTVNDYCYEFAPTLTSGSISDAAEIETSVGGTMTKLGGTIKYTTNGLSFESSSDSKVSVTLDGKMQAGSVITIEMYVDASDKARGFKLANSSGTVKATLTESTIGTYTKTYTVVAGDGIAGSSVFQIHRNNNAYLKSVTVSGCEPPHTVTYKANGGTGDDIIVDDAKTIASNTFTPPTAYTFDSWNTAVDGSGDPYNVGDAVSSDLILFAQWVCADVIATATAANGTAAQTYNKGDVAGAMTATGGTIFQWYRSSEDNIRSATRTIMEGQTSATLTPSTAVFGTTYYFCVVSNACGNKDTTNTVAITIEDPNPAPTADWTGTTTDPTHGAGGYTVTVVAKNYDGSDLWDGTLTDAMLSASDGITLSGVTVNNTTKTITATYAVTAAAETPITFTLSLPATATHKAADLTYDVAFTECAGGEANTILFLSSTKDDSGNDLGQIKTGSSCLVGGGIAKLMTGSSNAGLNTSSNKNGYRCDPNYLIVVFKFEATTNLTIMHNANSTGGRYVQLFKFSSAKALSEITSSDWSSKTVQAFTSTSSAETWGGGGTSSVTTNGANTTWNYGTKGCLSVTWEDLSEGYYVLIGSGSEAYLYGFSYESEIGGGSLTTTLAWSNSQADGATLQKGEYDADFTITATRSNANATASLGAINYTSSDESVATINAATGRVTIADNIDFGGAEYKTTTITATLAASGCYQRAQITYILRVNKQECEDAEGVIASTNLGCAGVLLTLSGYSAGATIAWYKDDAVIPGETGTTYTATSAGSYYAATTLTGAGHCTKTSNTVVIEDVVLADTAIVDQWYIKNGRRTPDIELVATTGATSFIVKSGSTVIWNSDGSVSTGFGGCEFYMDANGTIYLKGEKADGSATTGLTAGDETLTFYVSGCGDADPVNIVIHKQEATLKPSIAFVVGETKDKKPVGAGDLAVNTYLTTGRPIWTYLSSYYTLTGCNAYWTNDEKTLREYYSQYDAILITDDPDTDIKPSSGKAYVNALGTMVDVRPLLTLEAFVGKYGASSNWHIGATPHSPKPRQYEMKLQCKDHTIFNSLTTEPLPDNVRMVEEDGIEYYYVTMVARTGVYDGLDDYDVKDGKNDKSPALQGFETTVIPGVLGVGTIDGGEFGMLRGGVERQEEPAARMMILGINHEAMAELTPQGKLVIKQALDYLLLTNMDDVDDCSNYFIGGTAGHETDWHTGTNWTAGHAPDKTVTARILAPCTVSSATKASAAAVDIVTGGRTTRYKSGASDCEGTLTIQPTGTLISEGRILQIAEAPYFIEGYRVPTTPAILKVEANSTNTGALIFDNEAGKTQATVEMYVPSHWEVDGATGKKKKYWSYIGVPIKNVDIPNYFYLGFTYYYDETAEGAWVKRGDGTVLQPFEGIGASMKTAGKEIFTGTLASTETQEITLTKTTAGGNGENLIGNSWTAPIQIAAFTASDFGDATQTVFVYNSGRDDVYHNPTEVTADEDNDGAATAGQWVGVPIGVAGLGGYTGLKVIPAMNAFEIKTASETTLTLDYDKLVRPATNDVNAPLRAQKRNTAEANEIDGLLRVRVTGEKTHTDVWLLQDARFDYGFDNGWEAGYQDCDDRSSQLYAVSEIGRMAFLAQPDIDGTVLGFAPSRDGDEYTFSFYYLGDEVLYLNDLKQQTSTLVSDENIYRFTYEEGDTNRFIISATPFGSPSVTTGNEEVLHPDRVKKVVYRDHVYIIRGGKIYDVIGKIVR